MGKIELSFSKSVICPFPNGHRPNGLLVGGELREGRTRRTGPTLKVITVVEGAPAAAMSKIQHSKILHIFHGISLEMNNVKLNNFSDNMRQFHYG